MPGSQLTAAAALCWLGLQGVGSTCDLNPLNKSLLASSDEFTTIKMLLLKIIFILVATVLDQVGNVQTGIMAVAMWGVVYYMFDGVCERQAPGALCEPAPC